MPDHSAAIAVTLNPDDIESLSQPVMRSANEHRERRSAAIISLGISPMALTIACAGIPNTADVWRLEGVIS